MMAARPCLAALLASVALAGCGTGPRTKPEPPPGPLPSYATIVGAYNARVAGLDRVWARSVVRVWYPDLEGEEQKDQVEGHIQYLRPRSLLLTFKKLGETYAALGSNDERYWWIELGDQKVAWVGEHAQASAERAREMGLPVQPLELIRLLGLLPLPEPGSGATPAVTRTPGGREIVVTMFPIEGSGTSLVKGVRYRLDPVTFEPRRIELLDRGGRMAMEASLSHYQPVAAEVGRVAGSIPGQVQASLDGGERRMHLWLHEPENTENRPGPRVFDLEAVLASYGVTDVRSIDEVAAAAPEKP
jgi:hypothetical protein